MPPQITTDLLKQLRNIMKDTNYVSRRLQAYVIPSCDAHQSEYIAPCDQRRAFISGFTGSDGIAVVTENEAQLWTDSRYTLQAERELDENWTLFSKDASESFATSKRLSEKLPAGSNVGVDPFLMSYKTWSTLSKSLKKRGHTLVPVDTNLVDVLWKDKPARPANKVEIISFDNGANDCYLKLKDVQCSIREENTSALVITALDEIAWLYNLRGSDIPFNPVFFAYSVVTQDSVWLLVNEECMAGIPQHYVNKDGLLQICPYQDIAKTIESVLSRYEGNIWFDPHASYGIVSLVPENRRHISLSPIAYKKAVKNTCEIEASKRAHVRDGVSLCELFCWMSKEIDGGNITELSAAHKLDEFKRTQSAYIGPSFETISGSGPNGAVIHYRCRKETNRPVTSDQMYLCDSGSQYGDGGTTDVTRTLHFGTPSEFQKRCYTLVLKGVIAVTTAVFPKNIQGCRLDSFARQALWEQGLDYLHGTGHGVGAYLNVHEGPIGIGIRERQYDMGLEPGMILSIEPGYYEDGSFGIRLENLAVIKEAKTPYNFKNMKFLTFETLTLVPYQKKLLEPSLLNEKEVQWLNDYHNTCREIVGPVLKAEGKTEALQWLLKETEPLG